ncbi:hypothetical protein SAMN05216273_101230 [Chryseobacterium taihuense]|uniref:Uncharacterized protein n=1 Tax=Chryseobacterium taihuense TaxID=1141221 RepID=A0ABY0QPT2_9FLAO|nr:hypothetical protein SAMN05216273_101230 [Chryseobacterium taihuense]
MVSNKDRLYKLFDSYFYQLNHNYLEKNKITFTLQQAENQKVTLRFTTSFETVIGITTDKHCIFFFRNYLYKTFIMF